MSVTTREDGAQSCTAKKKTGETPSLWAEESSNELVWAEYMPSPSASGTSSSNQSWSPPHQLYEDTLLDPTLMEYFLTLPVELQLWILTEVSYIHSAPETLAEKEVQLRTIQALFQSDRIIQN